MATEDKVKVLEDEFKLIKSEVKQTLGSVRDFLMDMKLPPVQDDFSNPNRQMPQPAFDAGAPAPQAPSTQSPEPVSQPSTSGISGGGDGNMPFPDPFQPAVVSEEPELESLPEDQRVLEDEISDIDAAEDTGITSGDMPTDEVPDATLPKTDGVNNMKLDETRPGAPQVNLLANLIRWAAIARKEIGQSQLATFLDVYATTGNLLPEMKNIILHLAEVTGGSTVEIPASDRSYIINEPITLCMEINNLAGQISPEIKEKLHRLTEILLQQSTQSSKADIWSKLLLELHGILIGSGSPLKPLMPVDQKAEAEGLEQALADSENSQTEAEAEESETPVEDENIDSESPVEPEDNPANMKDTRPARLRLILPVGDGSEQELDLGNLFIATDAKKKSGNGHIKSKSIKR